MMVIIVALLLVTDRVGLKSLFFPCVVSVSQLSTPYHSPPTKKGQKLCPIEIYYIVVP